MHIELVERLPTVLEYMQLISTVGWKRRDPNAISSALAGSLFAVCAELSGTLVGMGRVIGDGGLHHYLADVVVHPTYQRRGVGSRIVETLTAFVERVPHKNTWAGVFAVEGTASFYD